MLPQDPLAEIRPADKTYLYTNINFPCLVGRGEAMENLKSAKNDFQYYHIMARNALRHLTYGTSIYETGLLNWTAFKALFITKNPKLLKALRVEMEQIFWRSYEHLSNDVIDPEASARLEIFIKNLLAAYPYMDPEEGEEVYLPKKAENGKWDYVGFKFNRLDISPQAGLISYLMTDEYRLYAYGLAPLKGGYSPYLLLMGTQYPGGQGASLNWLHNFTPMKSIGEGHDLKNVQAWLEKHPDTIVSGHSKGGTLAMIVAALYPKYVKEANCLNPAPLTPHTLARLKKIVELKAKDKPAPVHVYVQMNDPVFLLGKQFSEGSLIYQIGNKDDHYSLLESHAHYLAGRKSTIIAAYPENDSKLLQRGFISEMKEVANWAIFPPLYIHLVYKLGLDHVRSKLGQGTSKEAIAFNAGKALADIFTAGILLGVLVFSAAIAILIGFPWASFKTAIKAINQKKNPKTPDREERPEHQSHTLGTTAKIAKDLRFAPELQPSVQQKKDNASASATKQDVLVLGKYHLYGTPPPDNSHSRPQDTSTFSFINP
ncbi:MAG: hypothetical protein H0W64_01525 [Gammaproteobacteria bacterium]|nr:hypothetical protein [Gammaproteobacteria bacterium]